MGVAAPGVLDRLPELRRERTRLLRSLITERRRTAGRQGDFLEALLRSQKKHGFGEDLIVETLVSLTTAGISTVATALEWLLLLLARDEIAQGKARADVCGSRETPYLGSLHSGDAALEDSALRAAEVPEASRGFWLPTAPKEPSFCRTPTNWHFG